MWQRSMATSIHKQRVFLDADVIFAGSASPQEHSASGVILTLGEVTLLDCVTSVQAVTEVERNLRIKIPSKLPEFQLLVSRSLRIVEDPLRPELEPWRGQADSKDLPILVSAIQAECDYLLTFNVRHFMPEGTQITVMRPGDYLLALRRWLSWL